MARRRRRRGLAGDSTPFVESICRLPSEREYQRCGTEGKTTVCAGDKVVRQIKKDKYHGTVIAVGPGKDNKGKAKLAAFICLDDAEPRDLAYPYLFSEFKKR